jgi:hypothetical protein
MRIPIALLVFIGLISPCFGQENELISKKLTVALEQIYKQNHIIGFSVAIVNQHGTLYKNGFDAITVQ